MRVVLFASALLCAALAVQSARADEPAFLYGYVQVMNNYVGRGLSQSVGAASSQVEVDVNPGAGVYGNVSAVRIGWVDAIYPGDRVHVEVDGVVGYRALFGDGGSARVGVLRLQYPGHYATPPSVLRPDTTEVFGYVGWSGLSARLNYAVTDAYGTPDSRGAWYLDTNATLPLGARWTAGAHAGRKQSRGTDPSTGADNAKLFSYTDYKLSLTRLFGAASSLSLAYSWTNARSDVYTVRGYNVAGRHLALTFEQDF